MCTTSTEIWKEDEKPDSDEDDNNDNNYNLTFFQLGLQSVVRGRVKSETQDLKTL